MKINSIYSVHFLHMFFIYGKYVWNVYLIKEHHFFVAIFGTMIISIYRFNIPITFMYIWKMIHPSVRLKDLIKLNFLKKQIYLEVIYRSIYLSNEYI